MDIPVPHTRLTGGYSGVITSPTFLQPTSASGVRRTTMNLNLTF